MFTTPKLEIFTHFIKVSHFDAIVREALKRYCVDHLAQWGPNPSGVQTIQCVYVSSHADRRVFRFHRNELRDILQVLNSVGYSEQKLEIVTHPLTRPKSIYHRKNPKDNRVLRPEQEELVNYLLKPPMEGWAPTKLIEMQTGGGKGLTALTAIERLGTRCLLFIKPMYIDKWVAEIKEAFQIKKGNIIVVRGSDGLKSLFAIPSHELKAKFIVMSIPTFRNYLAHWEANNGQDQEEYGVNPEEFYSALGIGVKLMDEVHQEFHAVYRSELFTHCPLSIGLSATVESDKPFINNRAETLWPYFIRPPKIEHNKYIIVKNLWYHFQNRQHCPNFETFMGYSHILFEKWAMKKNSRLLNFYTMIEDVLNRKHVLRAQPGQKAVIFCATKLMCTYIAEQLSAAFPSKNVKRYIQGDSYQKNLIESDITVTTLKSAGTAVDVPNLKTCICTVAVSSKQANEQAIGRLRVLRNYPGEHPEFYFLSCQDIERHRIYAYDKARKLHGKILDYEHVDTAYKL